MDFQLESDNAIKENHLGYLRLSILVIFLSFVLTLNPQNGGEVSFFSFKLPGVCTSQYFFSVPCPGCGLTRSFVAMAHGQFKLAFEYNRIGPLLFGLVLLQLPYRIARLNNRLNSQFRKSEFLLSFPGYFILMAMIINWLLLRFGI
ncbi:MAG: DUF2752 domain-containing protein [Candidatus Riflebacteria bacterium]|nr:DUF2752 domain-containing protein [Candidatus Riflebacteria bacterium]